MKAVVYRGINDLRLEDVAEPRIESPNDVIIKVNLSSICGSDIHVKGAGLHEPGMIVGHEYTGVVLDTGESVLNFKKGNRIIGKPFYHCGYCFYCEHQQPELCENVGLFGLLGTQGVQAEYARIPFAENVLKKIPDDMSDEDVLFVADILSTGYTGVIRGRIGVGETVAVFGVGPVGLCAVACAQLFEPGLVIAVDTIDYRIDFAESLGAVPINAAKEDSVARVKELTGGRGVDVGIEAAGLEPTFKACVLSTRRGGRVSVLGMFTERTNFNIAKRCDDIFTLSIGLGELSHTDELIRMVHAGRLNPKAMITHRMPLMEALRGYEIFEKKLENCIKIVLQC